MHNHPQDDQASSTSTDELQERMQRDQEERSRQALANQGSQGRKPSQANANHDTEGDKPQQ